MLPMLMYMTYKGFQVLAIEALKYAMETYTDALGEIQVIADKTRNFNGFIDDFVTLLGITWDYKDKGLQSGIL